MSFFRKSYQSHSDEALMVLIQGGNERAFEELHSRYSKRLLYYFYKMLGRDEAKAQDFLQDLFVRVVEKAHLYQPEQPFETWVFSVAHNQCKNEYRRTALRNNIFGETEASQIPDTSADFTENYDTAVFKQMLDEELDNMDTEQRTAFVLRYQENLSLEKIAQVLNCPEGTVKSRLFYTKKRLAAKLRIFNLNG